MVKEHVGELGRDDQQPFCVGLGRGDLQQRNQLTGRWQPVMDQAVVGQLGEFLDADTGVAQHLDHRPGPEAAVLCEGEVATLPAVGVLGPDAAGGLALHDRAAQGLTCGGEQFTGRAAFGGSEQVGGAGPFGLDPGRQRR